MSNMQDMRRRQLREGRLEIVAQLYKKGYPYRKIREEVMRRLNLSTYSLGSVKGDVDLLLKEWREERVKDVDSLLSLELARIDDTCTELWSQWEKSKSDWTANQRTRRGAPRRNAQNGDGHPNGDIQTLSIEEHSKDERGLGNVAYIQEIRNQLAERRKLLGLYAPEKKDITTGGDSFAALLIESGMLDRAEKDASGR